MVTIASAPAKVILFGEHSVVYQGHVGLAAAINRKSSVTVAKASNNKYAIKSEQLGTINFERPDSNLADAPNWAKSILQVLAQIHKEYGYCPLEINIDSEIPSQSHLGSGSSVFAALAYATLNELKINHNRELVAKLAYCGDMEAHGGKPSGIDNNTVTYGGLLKFTRKENGGDFEFLKLPYELELLICDSGERCETGPMIKKVREHLCDNPASDSRLSDITKLANDGLKALLKKDLRTVGEKMYKNQEILAELGASTPKINEIVQIAKGAGAYGAKLTGAGGGGCVIILAEDYKNIESKLADAGYKTFMAKLSSEGVKLT